MRDTRKKQTTIYHCSALALLPSPYQFPCDHDPLDVASVFLNDTAPNDIYTRPYTLSLHDALPISSPPASRIASPRHGCPQATSTPCSLPAADRKSTRLNSSHTVLSRMPSSA